MSDIGGMSPEEFRERMLQLMANRLRVAAGQLDMAAAVVKLGASVRAFNEAFAASEALEIAGHPDLAELNVQMDGYYGGPGR